MTGFGTNKQLPDSVHLKISSFHRHSSRCRLEVIPKAIRLGSQLLMLFDSKYWAPRFDVTTVPLEVRSSASGTAETNSIHVAINTARVGPDLCLRGSCAVHWAYFQAELTLLDSYRQKLLTMLLSCHASTALQKDALPQQRRWGQRFPLSSVMIPSLEAFKISYYSSALHTTSR